MHVRRGRYIGVAPVPGGLTNVCLVRPSRAGDADARAIPRRCCSRELARDPLLRDRFAGARLAGAAGGPRSARGRRRPRTTIDGLLLAGDAAGFIDPMTGDGLRFAVRGGELAAAAALRRARARLDRRPRAAGAPRAGAQFAGKWRFNRALRALVASPRAVDLATLGGRVAPAHVRAAGDARRRLCL